MHSFTLKFQPNVSHTTILLCSKNKPEVCKKADFHNTKIKLQLQTICDVIFHKSLCEKILFCCCFNDVFRHFGFKNDECYLPSLTPLTLTFHSLGARYFSTSPLKQILRGGNFFVNIYRCLIKNPRMIRDLQIFLVL